MRRKTCRQCSGDAPATPDCRMSARRYGTPYIRLIRLRQPRARRQPRLMMSLRRQQVRVPATPCFFLFRFFIAYALRAHGHEIRDTPGQPPLVSRRFQISMRMSNVRSTACRLIFQRGETAAAAASFLSLPLHQKTFVSYVCSEPAISLFLSSAAAAPRLPPGQLEPQQACLKEGRDTMGFSHARAHCITVTQLSALKWHVSQTYTEQVTADMFPAAHGMLLHHMLCCKQARLGQFSLPVRRHGAGYCLRSFFNTAREMVSQMIQNDRQFLSMESRQVFSQPTAVNALISGVSHDICRRGRMLSAASFTIRYSLL